MYGLNKLISKHIENIKALVSQGSIFILNSKQSVIHSLNGFWKCVCTQTPSNGYLKQLSLIHGLYFFSCKWQKNASSLSKIEFIETCIWDIPGYHFSVSLHPGLVSPFFCLWTLFLSHRLSYSQDGCTSTCPESSKKVKAFSVSSQRNFQS